MDQPAPSVHVSHDEDGLDVGLAEAGGGEGGVFESGGGPAVGSEELHDEDVGFEEDWFGAGYGGGVEAAVVAEFFFGPYFDHFAGIGFAIPLSPPMFSRNILVPIFED